MLRLKCPDAGLAPVYRQPRRAAQAIRGADAAQVAPARFHR
ncbi:hypothetical protein SC1_02401 [Sphingopyxis sp. C-1]|nr:hypothetical protein SC1_02401 [Sphingopyxis sp. C-1]